MTVRRTQTRASCPPGAHPLDLTTGKAGPGSARSWLARACLAVCVLLMAGVATRAAWAQAPGGKSAVRAAPAAAPAPAASGPGYHSPQSPFAPIQEREGFVSWKMLAQVQTRPGKGQMIVTLPAAARALQGRTVKLQGFMMPLEVGSGQRHFLFTAIPPTCSFCIPAGPEGLVEVRSVEPVPYGEQAIEIEGTWQVLQDDPLGLYYRLTDAKPLRRR